MSFMELCEFAIGSGKQRIYSYTLEQFALVRGVKPYPSVFKMKSWYLNGKFQASSNPISQGC